MHKRTYRCKKLKTHAEEPEANMKALDMYGKKKTRVEKSKAGIDAYGKKK